MKYSITRDDLNTLDFNNTYKSIVFNEPNIDFYEKPGKEHYQLLSYFSTLFNNSNIIDIIFLILIQRMMLSVVSAVYHYLFLSKPYQTIRL